MYPLIGTLINECQATAEMQYWICPVVDRSNHSLCVDRNLICDGGSYREDDSFMQYLLREVVHERAVRRASITGRVVPVDVLDKAIEEVISQNLTIFNHNLYS